MIFFEKIKNKAQREQKMRERKKKKKREKKKKAKQKPQKLKQALKNELTKKELEKLRSSYDLVGDIAILEIPEELVKKEKTIAEKLLEMHKNIKVVVKKLGKHKGEYRLQKYKILAGERRKTTLYKEHDCIFKLHLEKTYFSVRLSTERKRIFEQVKKGEKVLVMFSGIAPYPITIAKKSEAKKVVGIEINPLAHEFGKENLRLNKLDEEGSGRVELICGDVRKVMPKLRKKEKFDRIVMPLPKTGQEFLGVALPAVKKEGIIHLYSFIKTEEEEEKKKEIRNKARENKRKIKILRTVFCGQVAKEVYRVCFDLKIN